MKRCKHFTRGVHSLASSLSFFLYDPHCVTFLLPLSDLDFVPLLREKQWLEKHES